MRMLVCADESKHSDKTIQEAVNIAEGLSAGEVILLHAYQLESSQMDLNVFYEGVSSNEVRKQMEDLEKVGGQEELKEQISSRRDFLARAAKSFEDKGIPVKLMLREGEPGEVICDAAAKEQVDMVVMGGRGRSGGGYSLGSVSSTVSQKCQSTTIIVK